MDRKADAVEILVRHQEAVLIRFGRPLDKARKEAESIVETVLIDMERIGLQDVYLGVALRRSRVYRLRSQGHTFKVICERLGICRKQAHTDYRSEMLRRRVG